MATAFRLFFYPGQKVYPEFQTRFARPTDGNVFFELSDLLGNALTDRIMLVHRGSGLYTANNNDVPVFPTGHEAILGRYHPIAVDGQTPDGSHPAETDIYQMAVFPHPALSARTSIGSFVAGEPPVNLVIGSPIKFYVKISESDGNTPENLSIYTKVEVVFCGNDGELVVPATVTDSGVLGILRVIMTAEQTAKLTLQSSGFDIRKYGSSDSPISVTPVRNALTIFGPICD